MIYTILATVEIAADSAHEAYEFLKHGLNCSKKAEIIYLDAEVTERRLEDHEEPEPPRKLTRQERLEAMADSGCDTWEEYRGER